MAVFYHRGDLVLYSSKFPQAANLPNQFYEMHFPHQIRCCLTPPFQNLDMHFLGKKKNKTICTFHFLQCKFHPKAYQHYFPPPQSITHGRLTWSTFPTNLEQLRLKVVKERMRGMARQTPHLKSPPSDRGKEMTSWGFYYQLWQTITHTPTLQRAWYWLGRKKPN